MEYEYHDDLPVLVTIRPGTPVRWWWGARIHRDNWILPIPPPDAN